MERATSRVNQVIVLTGRQYRRQKDTRCNRRRSDPRHTSRLRPPLPMRLPTASTNLTINCWGQECEFRGVRVKNQFWTAPNQLTLLRLMFIPFVITNVLDDNWRWALGLLVFAGLSDGLDGWLARMLNQQTMLGQYLDPIADKLLLSSLFLVLSIAHKIPWKYTMLVLSRDLHIGHLHGSLRHGRLPRFPSQHLRQDQHLLPDRHRLLRRAGAGRYAPWVAPEGRVSLRYLRLQLLSGIHYILVTGQRLRNHTQSRLPRMAKLAASQPQHLVLTTSPAIIA